MVEDERHISRYLEFVLSRAGYEVAVAHDGTEAVARLDSFPANAILLDLVMPKMSGLELLKTLQGRPGRENMIVIVLSARSSAELPKELEDAGANAMCPKPVGPSKLLAELARFGVTPEMETATRC